MKPGLKYNEKHIFCEIYCQVECKELFYRELPEMNDAIADKLLPGSTSIEQVRHAMRNYHFSLFWLCLIVFLDLNFCLVYEYAGQGVIVGEMCGTRANS